MINQRTITDVTARERWLASAVELIRPIIEERAGLVVPAIRIAAADCGKRIMGLAYDANLTTDNVAEITISFSNHDMPRTWEIVGTIAHEMIHAAGVHGHRGRFARAARAIGLLGKPSEAGLDGPYNNVPEHFKAIVRKLDDFPAGKVLLGARGSKPKKQTTRMIKGECACCGLTLRMTRTWIERATKGEPARCVDPECAGELVFDC